MIKKVDKKGFKGKKLNSKYLKAIEDHIFSI